MSDVFVALALCEFLGTRDGFVTISKLQVLRIFERYARPLAEHASRQV